MSIKNTIWEYFRKIFNPWLSKNWHKLEKNLREDLMIFRDKLYGCHSVEEAREVICTLGRLYMISPNEIKDSFAEMIKETEEHFKRNNIEVDLTKRLTPHKIQIIVKDDANKPLKSVQVTVMYNGREIWKGLTGEDGRITLNLSEGKYTIFASLSDEEWYGLNIMEINVPTESMEKTITIKKYPKYETVKTTVKN